MDWDDYPVILGFGSTHEMRNSEDPEPRLWRMRSVSRAGAKALQKSKPSPTRQVGFMRGRNDR